MRDYTCFHHNKLVSISGPMCTTVSHISCCYVPSCGIGDHDVLLAPHHASSFAVVVVVELPQTPEDDLRSARAWKADEVVTVDACV